MSLNEGVGLFLSYENRTCFKSDPKKVLPVTLITGFLGSGKTTLLNYLVTNKQQLRIAAAVNDFASLNVDSELISNMNDQNTGVVALSNGCLCCTLSDSLQDTVWKLLQGDFSDFAEQSFDDIDYLVIETSGITDPLALIELLERKYGKMTRVRLDSVVTVLDTDTIFDELQSSNVQGNPTIKSEIAMNQLRCADIVLLNKKDIVTEEQFSVVENWVKATVPLAALYGCEYSRVPLPNILDVEYRLFDTGQGSIQREQSSTPYVLQSREDPLLRRAENRQTATSRSVDARKLREERKEKHISNENFKSLVFEANMSTPLWYLQDLLSSSEENGGFSNSIVRAKGFLSFDINPLNRYVFHWSGRRRYQIHFDSVCQVARTRMVFIGHSVDSSVIEKLENIPSPKDESQKEKQREECLQLLRSDKLFEIVMDDTNAVYFRLTGISTTPLSMKEIDERFGIDFDKMNEDLVRSINSSPGHQAFIIPETKNDIKCLVFAYGGNISLPHLWQVIQHNAQRLVNSYFAGVQACLCGF